VTSRDPRRKSGKLGVAVAAIVVLSLAATIVIARAHRGHDTPPAAQKPGATQYGASFQMDNGESYQAALARTDRTLGHLDVVRVFYPAAPDPWPGKAPGRNVMVSFKLSPRDVIAGAYDKSMKHWFATAPKNLDVYWAYWHEPENDIEAGTFTAGQFKAAFARLDRLAVQAHNPRLKATVILQSYSTRTGSGRNWSDYIPPVKRFDILAWDVYNKPSPEAPYTVPPDLLDAPLTAARTIGKPFAVAELGSALAPGDTGEGRAEWLMRMGAYLDQHHALFACYFDFLWNDGKQDFRLTDQPSLRAWRDIASS
jgi:hypothetical protein